MYLGATADNEIFKCSFYSPSTGYIGFRDFVGFTTDSGRTIIQKQITTGNVNYNGYSVNLTFGFYILGLKAFNQNNIIVYGHYGLVPSILYSTNGGTSFTLVFHSQFIPTQLSTGITDMVFPQNNSIGYAIDADRILKTTDGGINWNTIRIDHNSCFDRLEGIDNNNVYAISDYNINEVFPNGDPYFVNKILKTTNGGSSWTTVNVPAGNIVTGSFITAAKGWVNVDDLLYYTPNSGTAWTAKNSATASPLSTTLIKFINDSTGFALQDLFTVSKTTDSGRVWEPLPRDNNYTYLGYSHNEIHYMAPSQIWAGGGHGFLEMSTNLGGTPIPKAYFDIDTVGYYSTGIVNLKNYSKRTYTYKWFVNNTQISTAYNTSYTHDVNHLTDTITLIVSNGTLLDTLTKYQGFYPPVIITSFTPSSAGTGNIVTINGSGFTGASSVSFGGVPATGFTVVSDIKITATVGAGASGSVSVISLTGHGSLAGFTYIGPPTITSFTPTAATAGTVVTITGTQFVNVSAVNFAGVAATSFTVVSPTTITAVAPSGPSGSISVTTPGGTATLAGYISLPTINSFSPTSGTEGTILTITGTSFSGANTVTIGGVAALSFTVNSSTSITAVVGAGATGNVNVSKPGGSSSLPIFTWHAAPVITSFSPGAGPVGTVVTIAGSNFNPVPANNIVYFGKIKATVSGGGATSLTVTVPVGATFDPITVTSNNLTGYSTYPFLLSFANGGSIHANSFANRTDFPVSSSYSPYMLNTADLDGDGKLDLVEVVIGGVGGNTGLLIYRNMSSVSSVSFAPPLFLAATTYKEVQIADIDGDGKLDIAVIGTKSVITYRNTSTVGSISFAAGPTLSSGLYDPIGINLTDLDGDGKPELVEHSSFYGTSLVYRNISNPGTIAFAAGFPIAAYGSRNNLLIDIDGDSKTDIIIPQSGDDSLIIFKNNSTKGNLSFTRFAFAAFYSNSYYAYGDFDGDGKIDLVLAFPSGNNVTIFRNTSSGGSISFADPVLLNGIYDCTGISASDMDGDGKLDIVSTLYDHEMSMYKNFSTPGNLVFGPRVDVSVVQQSANYPVLGDIDGDGKNDVAFLRRAGSSSGIISILLNTVNAAPGIASFTPTIGTAGTSVTITGVNFNNVTGVSFGGTPAASYVVNSPTSITAVVGAGASGAVVVTNNSGTDTLQSFVYGYPPTITSIAPTFGAVGSTVVITGTNFNPVAANNIVYFGKVKGTVTASTPTSISVTVPTCATYDAVSVTTNNLTAYSSQLFSVTFPGAAATFSTASFGPKWDKTSLGFGNLADIDGDGKIDWVVANSTTGFSVERNTSTIGNLSFAPDVVFNTGYSSVHPYMGDLDGDGKADIVMLNTNRSLSICRNTSTVGNVSLANIYTLQLDVTNSPNSFNNAIIRDLDGDGKPDLTISYSGQNILIFRNISTAGNIAFAPLFSINTNGSNDEMSIQDINGDGKPDIVAVGGYPYLVNLFVNRSTPGIISFNYHLDYQVNDNAFTSGIADMDGDGKSDIVTGNAYASNVSILRNIGTFPNVSFAPKIDFAGDYGVDNMDLGDLDGDGKLDAVIGSFGTSNQINFYKNVSTPGSLMIQPRFAYSITYPAFTYIGDMDGDGRPDVSVFRSGGTESILLNQTGNSTISTVYFCQSSGTTLTSNLTGTTYQWQLSTGGAFNNISNNSNYAGVATANLVLTNIPYSFNGYQYRCLVNGTTYSNTFVVSVYVTPTVSISTPTTSVCSGTNVTFTANALNAGQNPSYQWKINGVNTGPNSATFTTTTLVNLAQVSVTITSNICGNATAYNSNQINMSVTPTPPANAGVDQGICSGASVSIGTGGCCGYSYSWTSNPVGFTSAIANPTANPLVNTSYFLLVTNYSCTARDTVNISVTGSATANAGADRTICTGDATALGTAALPGHTYFWVSIPAGFTSTIANPTVNPTVTTSYIVTASNGGCTAKDTVIVVVTPTVAANAGPDQALCGSGNVTIGTPATSGNSYSWTSNPPGFNSIVANPTVSPTITTSYYLVVTNGSCISYDTTVVSIGTPVTANAGADRTICGGTGTTIGTTAIPGNSYSWISIPAGYTSTIADPIVNPVITTSYIVTVSNGGCTAKDTVVVNVNTAPVANAGPDKPLCSGTVVIGTAATGGNTYGWTSNPPGFTSIIANPTVSPLLTTSYYLVVSNGTCQSYDTVVVTVGPPLVVNAGADRAICAGSSTAIGSAAVSGQTYSWISIPAGYTSTLANPTVNPTVTTSYIVSVSNGICNAKDTVLVTVNPIPLANAGPDANLCNGGSVVIGTAAVAGNTYSWTSNPVGFVSSLANPTVSPTLTTSYYLVVTINGCVAYDTVVVTVGPAITVNAGSDATICSGSSTGIGTASLPGYTYSWISIPAGFTSSTANPTITPSITRSYILTANNGFCTGKDTVIITVNPQPVANAGPDQGICSGSVVIGTAASGTNTYSWTSNPAGFTSTIADPTVSPVVTTTYYLVVTNGSCVAMDTVVVSVGSLIVNAGPDKTLCTGNATTIGSAAIPNYNYNWISNPAGFSSTSANPSVSPSVTTTYILTATSGSCVGKDTVIVTVAPLPIANAGPDGNTCLGSIVIGTPAVGSNTYSWTSNPSGFASTLANPTVNPAVTTTYYLVVSNGTCSARDTVIVSVGSANANAGIDRAICVGRSTTIGSSPVTVYTYSWSSSPAGFNSSIANPSVSPMVATSYFLTVTNGACTSRDTVVISIAPISIADAGNSGTIACGPVGPGMMIGTPAISGYTYSWSPATGLNNSLIAQPIAKPASNTLYTITSTNASGCQATDTVTVKVNPGFIATLRDTSITICKGADIHISNPPVQNYSYKWTSSQGGFSSTFSDLNVTPIKTTTYILTQTNIYTGCQAISQVKVKVDTCNRSSIGVYPNPANTYIMVELDPNNNEQKYFKLLDSKGSTVINTKLPYTTRIDISRLSAGIYFYIIQVGENMEKGKLVIAH